jgi:pimeloyl-ACP methyl ester carboxylesterase
MQTDFPGETIRLPDGRALGFAEYGDPDGAPLFFFYGLWASRLTYHPDDQIARSLGVRLITIDRPGIGLSDPKPGRRLIDWPADVAALADALQIQRFAVLGWSGGGAYALACAYRIPERLIAVGLASGGAPLAGIEPAAHLTRQWKTVACIAWIAPWSIYLFAWYQTITFRYQSHRFVEQLVQRFPRCDQDILAQPGMHQMMLETTQELYRQGCRGLYEDLLVFTRPWGFRLEEIHLPVQIWHGEADNVLAPTFAHYLAGRLPQCQATLHPNEGHLLLFKRWRDLLQSLTLRRETGIL